MNKDWDWIFETYVRRFTSPDGRDTFETSDELVKRIILFSDLSPHDTVIDMGCGWGNVSLGIAPFVEKVIGIEPNDTNIQSAKRTMQQTSVRNVEYRKGSFEAPGYAGKVDKIISSLVFHQVKKNKRQQSLANVKNLLQPDGSFILCDTLMFFDPREEREKFNAVYRYLLAVTTPSDIYDNHIKPYLADTGYMYSWYDMEKYTPEDYRYYSKGELEKQLLEIGMEIKRIEEFSPFFGIFKIENIG
ncbi:class I SAM-dependent methyltransferase [Limibacterium fermenti]|uniref:class I SAM-dependent methyltransferase n=1 Tax=Limibacterium fermenti TaxID=3229863 RepID=UPI000E9B2523|nr:hypothetical protein [Porphyromonadaceae bacterium]